MQCLLVFIIISKTPLSCSWHDRSWFSSCLGVWHSWESLAHPCEFGCSDLARVQLKKNSLLMKEYRIIVYFIIVHKLVHTNL